jgi:peptidoglycan/LPS O-acetylase OafA/YrhL
MWFSILFMAIVRHLLSNTVPISAQTYFFYGTFHPWIDLIAILRNCILIDFHANPITWTMYVEVIGSLFIPLMIAIAQKGWRIGFGFLLILTLAAWWTHAGTFDARNYLFCFQAGVLLACYPGLTRKPQVAQWSRALFIAGWILIFIQRMASIDRLPGTLLLAVGASMLLAAVLGAPSVATFRWLDQRPVRLLGRVSYSLYLLHLAVMYALAETFAGLGILPKFGGIVAILLLTICTVGFTTSLAWLSYAAIELPFIRLGRALAAVKPADGTASSTHGGK